MNIYKSLEFNAKRKLHTVIFPESNEPRVLEAVEEILRRRIAKAMLIDQNEELMSLFKPHKDLTIVDAKFSTDFSRYYRGLKSKKNKTFSLSNAIQELNNPLTFSCILLKKNFADAVIAGSVYPTSEVLRNAISIIGPSHNNKTVSSFFLFTFPKGHFYEKKVFAYADCGTVPEPDADRLSEIAIQTSNNFKKLTGMVPKTAFLSYSTKGSATGNAIDKIVEAVKLTKKKQPGLICDGELQFDAAFVPSVAGRKNPDGIIMGDANVFIFPDLNSGNIAYKITERIGGAIATGPVVQGLAKPVMDLSRGCNARDIVNMTLVACNLI